MPEPLSTEGQVDRARRLWGRPLLLWLERHAAELAVLAWYLTLTAVYLWPLLTRLDSGVPRQVTDPSLQATTLVDVANHLLALDFGHLYQGAFFFPVRDTLALSDAQVGLQPVALPLWLLTHDALLTLNLLAVATFPLTAITADRVARLLTGGSRVAGWLCGTVYAFAAYRFTHLVHLNLLSAWTIPLSFYLLELCLRRSTWRRAVAWAASLVIAASLALHYVLFLVLLEPVYVAVRLAADPDRRAMVGRLTRLIGPAVLAGVGTGVLLLPYLHLAAQGFHRTVAETFQFSARPLDYLVPAADAVVLHPLFAALAPATGPDERELAPGLLALALALGGVAYAAIRRRPAWLRAVLPWLAVGATAAVLSLGPDLWPNSAVMPDLQHVLRLPYAALAKLLPLGSLRSPARFGVLVLLAVAVLAGMSGAAIMRSPRLGRRARGALVVGAAVLLAVEYSVNPKVVPLAWGPQLPAVYGWLQEEPAGPVVELPTVAAAAATYELYSTVDGHPRLNGWSGFTPGASAGVNVSPVTSATFGTWLAACQGLDARYLVVHRAGVDASVAAAVGRAVSQGALRPMATFGSDTVYAVGP